MSLPPSPPPESVALQSSLDALARRGASRIRQWRLRQSARDALAWSPVALVSVPLGVLLAGIASYALGRGPVLLPLPLLAILALVGPPLFVALLVAWEALRFRPARAAALALHDANGSTAERLVTADEFLASPAAAADDTTAAFRRAAIADAATHAAVALEKPLPPIPVAARALEKRSWWGAAAALALVVLIQFVAFPPSSGKAASPSADAIAATPSNAKDRETTPRKQARREARAPVPVPAMDVPAESAAKSAPTRRLPRQEEAMEGEPGSGSGSRAGSASATTPAAGMSPTRKNNPAAKKEAANPPDAAPEGKEKRARPKPKQQKGAEMAAEADSGQGQASSSTSSASPFEVPEQPDKAGEMLRGETEDEAQDDEDEQENANGANKPMTNQRDPAVDRNLSTRPPQNGDQPANGRGGPGGLKKSRGVPSMILGIPVADRVPGTVNPGRSKVTQEFTRPKEESYARADAMTHAARAGMIGHLDQPELFPWRRALVENYFLSIREGLSRPAAPSESEQ